MDQGVIDRLTGLENRQRKIEELEAALRERDARIAELEEVLEAYAPNHPALEGCR